jgi:hypothetical protein
MRQKQRLGTRFPNFSAKFGHPHKNEYTCTSKSHCTPNIDAIDKLIGAKEWSQPGLEPGASRN